MNEHQSENPGASLPKKKWNIPLLAHEKDMFNLHGSAQYAQMVGLPFDPSPEPDTFIEEGSTLLGMGSSTEERLFVSFGQVIFKDGTFGKIQAQACDKTDQIVGLKGSKVNGKALQLAGSHIASLKNSLRGENAVQGFQNKRSQLLHPPRQKLNDQKIGVSIHDQTGQAVRLGGNKAHGIRFFDPSPAKVQGCLKALFKKRTVNRFVRNR